MKRTIPFIEVSMILPYVNVSLRYLSLSAIIFPMKRRDTSFMFGGSNYNIEINPSFNFIRVAHDFSLNLML